MSPRRPGSRSRPRRAPCRGAAACRRRRGTCPAGRRGARLPAVGCRPDAAHPRDPGHRVRGSRRRAPTFYANALKGAQHRLQASGYQITLMDTDERPDRERAALLALAAGRVDGMILCSSAPDASVVRSIERRFGSLSSCSTTSSTGSAPVASRSPTSRASAFSSGTSPRSHGHRRIGYVGGIETETSGANGWPGTAWDAVAWPPDRPAIVRAMATGPRRRATRDGGAPRAGRPCDRDRLPVLRPGPRRPGGPCAHTVGASPTTSRSSASTTRTPRRCSIPPLTVLAAARPRHRRPRGVDGPARTRTH